MNYVNEVMQDECVVYFRKYCEEIAEKARAEEKTDMLRKMKTLLSESGYSSSEIRSFIKKIKSMQ